MVTARGREGTKRVWTETANPNVIPNNMVDKVFTENKEGYFLIVLWLLLALKFYKYF